MSISRLSNWWKVTSTCHLKHFWNCHTMTDDVALAWLNKTFSASAAICMNVCFKIAHTHCVFDTYLPILFCFYRLLRQIGAYSFVVVVLLLSDVDWLIGTIFPLYRKQWDGWVAGCSWWPGWVWPDQTDQQLASLDNWYGSRELSRRHCDIVRLLLYTCWSVQNQNNDFSVYYSSSVENWCVE